MTMEDWASKLDAFLQFNAAEVLQDKEKVTAAIAKAFAESEFEKYRVIQDQLYQSDFDRLMEAKANKLSRLIPKTSDFFYTSASHFRPCYLKLTVVHGYVLFPRRVQTSPAVPSGTARYPGKA